MRFLIPILITVLSACAHETPAPEKSEKPPRKEAKQPDIRETLESKQSAIKECYDQTAKTHPGLRGRMMLEWKYNGQGHVTSVKVKHSVSSDLDYCVSHVISSTTFPPTSDGEVAKIRYPFNFPPAAN